MTYLVIFFKEELYTGLYISHNKEPDEPGKPRTLATVEHAHT